MRDTKSKTRLTFKKLATLCDTMEKSIESGDYDTMFAAWDKADLLTTPIYLSDYENTITACFDMYDSYKHQDEYMAEHRDEWSFPRYRLENAEREKFACATQAQQELVRFIYEKDEETVHEDLDLWRRYIDLFHTVAGLRVHRTA